MAEPGVLLERRGGVAVVTLNRPERWNAFNETMWAGLERTVSELEPDPGRVVVVVGAGDQAFCAGMDVNPDNPQVTALARAIETGDCESVTALLERIRRAFDRLVGLPVPVIAAVNGAAYGGGAELAARCDLRIMDPKAILRFSEVRLGLMPDVGGGVALTRLIGPGRAADLILTARPVQADEAFALGLASRVTAPGRALDEALALARLIEENRPLAVRSALEVIRRTPDLPRDQALELETRLAAALIASGECVHGIAAFLERRLPVFPDPDPPEAKGA
ncbi:MAG: enoyl-CoA hydratase/isomerase family protein [Proteobacteria bacterium]|nr:enoyl-CoA hydratase/isomerase family protein [Pseudomonadota bacterium]